MAGTAIKGVGNGSSVQIADMVTTAKQNAGTSFQAVWNKTQSGAQTATTGNRTRQAESRDVRRGDSLRNSGRQRNNISDASGNKNTDVDEKDSKDLEKAQEVLGTVVQNLMQRIADTFSISEEELQGTMNELGMQVTDLTDPAQLNELLMMISGAEDSFALLTDEALYSNVKGIMDLQKELVGQAQDELQISPEQWQNVVSTVAEEAAEPAITVEVEGNPADSGKAVQDLTDRLADTEQEPEIPAQTSVRGSQNAKSRDSEGGQNNTSEGQQGNLLLQNLKEGNFLSGLQETARTEGANVTDTQDIMRQIMDYMKVSVKADSSDLEMQLHPQSLGTLHVQMASKNGVVTANFITQNETVKAALESQMVQLKESFAEQGVKVEAIEVTVQTHQFEQNLEQGRGQQSSNENETGAGRRRTRRINLNAAALAEEEPQTEEDRITADMMSANGNTVDFTA